MPIVNNMQFSRVSFKSLDQHQKGVFFWSATVYDGNRSQNHPKKPHVLPAIISNMRCAHPSILFFCETTFIMQPIINNNVSVLCQAAGRGSINLHMACNFLWTEGEKTEIVEKKFFYKNITTRCSLITLIESLLSKYFNTKETKIDRKSVV